MALNKKNIVLIEDGSKGAGSKTAYVTTSNAAAVEANAKASANQKTPTTTTQKTTTTTSAAKPASNPPATSQFSSKVNVGQATTTPKNAATTVPTVAVVDTMPARTISTPSTATTTTVYTGNSLNVAPPQNTDNKTSGGGDKGYTPPSAPVTYTEPTPTVSYTAPSTVSSTPSSTSSSNYTYSGSSYTPTRAAFEPSAAYYKAMEETQRLLEQLKGGRTSYTDKINDALKGIETNPAFAYDFNTDPLFQSALASAMRSGQSAMQNTMGQAAALTGGYGNTYGQSVGNQAYNQFIQGAYDNLPDYYNLARNAYDADLANKYNLLNQYRLGDESEYERMYNDWENQYTMANDQYAKEYENYWQEQGFNEDSRRFLESIRQYDNDFNFKRERADVDDAHWDKTFDYNAYRDSVADEHWDKNFNYNAYRDSVSDTHWQKNYDLSKGAQEWEQEYKENQYKDSQKAASAPAAKTLDTSTINTIKAYASRGVGEHAPVWEYANHLVEDLGYDQDEVYHAVNANAPTSEWRNSGYTYDNNGNYIDSYGVQHTGNAGGTVYVDQFGDIYTGSDGERYRYIGAGKSSKASDDVYEDVLTGQNLTRDDIEAKYKKDWKSHVDFYR